MRKVIEAGRLIDGHSSRPIDNAVIVIDQDSIVAVGKKGEVELPREAEIIDLGAMTVLPGMADCHVHLGMNGELSFDPMTFKELIPFVAIRAAEYARRDLMAGFTMIRTMGDKGFTAVGLKQAITAGYATGPRLAVSGHQLTVTGGRDSLVPEAPPPESLFKICDGSTEVVKTVREQLKYDVDWVKLGITGAISLGDGLPGAQQFTDEEIRIAVDLAKMNGKKVSGHAHGADGVKAAIRAGIDSIEHGCLVDNEAIDMMVENGIYWVPTLSPLHYILEYGIQRGIPKPLVERSKAVRDYHLEGLAKGIKAGVQIVMGTDIGMPYNYHGNNAVELQLMVEAGMSEMQAVKAATSQAAEMLGWADKCGKVAPGLFADVIAVGGNPLTDIKALQKVDFVMEGGRVVKDERVTS